MEGTLASNALEIAIIGGLIAVIVAFITIGAVFVFRLSNRVDQLADQLAELGVKIEQSHRELSEKIDESNRETREELTKQMTLMKNEIIGALVNHTHPEPGGPPVFTAPPPAIDLPSVTPSEPEPEPVDADAEGLPTPAAD